MNTEEKIKDVWRELAEYKSAQSKYSGFSKNTEQIAITFQLNNIYEITKTLTVFRISGETLHACDVLFSFSFSPVLSTDDKNNVSITPCIGDTVNTKRFSVRIGQRFNPPAGYVNQNITVVAKIIGADKDLGGVWT